METTRLKFEEVEDLMVEGVDTRDAPRFCDAFFATGYNLRDNRECNEEELEQLKEDYPEELQEMAYMSLID